MVIINSCRKVDAGRGGIMNVILLEKIGKLGEIGETANVKSGYARNFLFPTGKAIPATKDNLEHFEQRKAGLLAAHNEKVAEAQKRAEKVKGLSLTIEVNASDEGKLFGSVGTREIAEAINAESGADIAKSEVQMPHGLIRDLGDYEIILDLGFDVDAPISVSVVSLRSGVQITDDGSVIEEIERSEEAPEIIGSGENTEEDESSESDS